LISKHLDDAFTWKNLSLVNKSCNKGTKYGLKEAKSKFENHLWNLVKKYPNKPWDCYFLSQNPNITWEIVSQNLDKKWNWEGLSRNYFTKHLKK